MREKCRNSNTRSPEFPNSGAAGISICNTRKRMAENTLQDFGYMYDIFPVGDNQYEISFDKYDFNMEWNQGMTPRNVGTAISGLLHGPVIDNQPIPTHWMGGRPCFAQPSIYFGGPFEIHFSKTVYIKP